MHSLQGGDDENNNAEMVEPVQGRADLRRMARAAVVCGAEAQARDSTEQKDGKNGGIGHRDGGQVSPGHRKEIQDGGFALSRLCRRY